MSAFLNDIKYAFRQLRKNPVFTTVVIVILAIGIGPTTVIFSVVNAVLLRPLPFKDPDQLVQISPRFDDPKFLRVLEQITQATGMTSFGNSRFDFHEIKKRNHVFEHISAIETKPFVDVSGDEAINVLGACISSDFLTCLGIQPFLGQDFSPEEDQPGNDQVMILGHKYWKQHHGANPDIIGKAITFKDGVYTIIGVLPSNIHFLEYGCASEIFSWLAKESGFKDIDIWKPLALTPEKSGVSSLLSFGTFLFARLKSDVTLEQAQAELDVISAQLTQEHKRRGKRSLVLTRFQERLAKNVRPALWILMGTVVFVLLIVCANVANMLLVRSLGRRREVAIRSALGAGRLQLIRQFLVENTLLSLIGGLCALLLTIWSLDVLGASLFSRMPRSSEIRVDGWILCFALILSVLTGVLISLASIIRLPEFCAERIFKVGGLVVQNISYRNVLHSVLLTSEIALSLILLVGAGLMVKSFRRLTNVDLGFDPENVLVVNKGLDTSLMDRIRQLPGVHAVAVGSPSLFPACTAEFGIVGRDISADGKKPEAQCMRVTEDYFAVLQIPLLTGRIFTPNDHADAERVAIINEMIAHRYFPDTSPLGHVLSCQGKSCRIVGVINDVRPHGLRSDTIPMIYIPFPQADWVSGSVEFIVRTQKGLKTMLAPIRREFVAMNPLSPVPRMSTLKDLLAGPAAPMRFNMQLLSTFGITALILASVGIYGTMAFSVSQRTREIGIRIALGAKNTDILRAVVCQRLKIILIGIGIGLAGALVLTQVIGSLLYDVSPADPLTFILMSLVLINVALLASYIPVRRATRINPMDVLRYE